MSSHGVEGGRAGFWGLLAALREFRAGPLDGDPSDRALARAAGVVPTTIGNWLAGTQFPQDEDKLLAVVCAVAARAGARDAVPGNGTSLLDEECWRSAYRAEASRRARVVSAGVERAHAARALAGPPTGWPLDEVSDPFALEVHRPVLPDDALPGLPALPTYLSREHDELLGQVVEAAAGGRSGIAVLVGGSSTGKTRACWEALEMLRNQPEPWRLWHPIDPSRPEAAQRALPHTRPRTVVWLNEAQFYLGPADAELGEQVAAGLRELLRDPGRAPVLVLATLWPKFWNVLTAHPPDGGDDQHAQARELLANRDITVPTAFTPAQVSQLTKIGDARLALAARSVTDGQVIQFLAGAPELLARYRNAPPAARALIRAAMDARRLGMIAGLPQAFLEAAAPGYLTEAEWDTLGEDWLEQALAYTAVSCNGARAPLSRIRPRPAGHHALRPAARRNYQHAELAAAGSGPLYRLADYLDQYGRAHHASQIPPADFWAAAAMYAMPGDQVALGDAAHARGLYRDAAQLNKNAVASGNFSAALYLMRPPNCLHSDPGPVHWAAANAPLDNPAAVAGLLDSLQQASAEGQAATLLARNPAAHVLPDDPTAVARLLDSLWEAGAREQVAVLAARAAAHVLLDHSYPVASLLVRLREAGADEQVAVLAARAAAQTPLDRPDDVASLLVRLREVGADEQAVTLLARNPAARAALDDPAAVASLLVGLWEAGADEQVAVMAARAAAHVPLENPAAVVGLLDSLRRVGADEQVAVLAGRAAAHVLLDHLYPVARLLVRLREAGAVEQSATLADRIAAHVPLDNPAAVAGLLDSLRKAGAYNQVDTLLARNPAAHVGIDYPAAVVGLLDILRQAGAREQVAVLAGRAAAHVLLDHSYPVSSLLVRLREVGADEQVAVLAARAAAHTPLGRPGDVASLLGRLREVGADEQVAVLAARAAAHVLLDRPGDVASLLDKLRKVGADEQVAVLAARAAAHVLLDHLYPVVRLLVRLRQVGADEQVAVLAARAATHIPLNRPAALASLLDSLRQVHADEQAVTLLARNPAAHAPLNNPAAVASLLDSLRQAGADEQATILAERAAAHAPLDRPAAAASLLDSLRQAGADEQATILAERAAAHIPLNNPSDVASLLASLREAGADEQATALADRLPAGGMFGLFIQQQGHRDQFRFGREPGGIPATPWGWGDLD